MLSNFIKNRVISGVIVGAIITLLCVVGISTGTFKSLHDRFADSLYTLNSPSEDIIIVAIDDRSTDADTLGRITQWTREYFAIVLDNIEADQAKVVSFDLLFHTYTDSIQRDTILELENEINRAENKSDQLEVYEEFLEKYKRTSRDPADNLFAESLNKYDNVVLATALAADQVIKPLDKFLEKARLGFTNAPMDEDGILRRAQTSAQVEAGNKTYDDYSVATAKIYLDNEEIEIPANENNEMLVNFFADPYEYKRVSFFDVMMEDFEPGTFTDKIVLVGISSAKEIHDEYSTPRSNQTEMPGVEFRANEIQTILEGKYIQDQGQLAQIITIAAISIALTIALNYIGIILAIILTILSLIAYLLAAHAFYDRGIILNMVYPFAAIVLSYLGSWVYKYFIADKGKRQMTDAFSHYVSEKLVDLISKNPDSVHLGGEKREITIFFSDIKGSTTYSEQIDTEKWVAQMNEYFTVMEKVIKKYDGTIDKYEGDAIMGFWNAPVSQENHQELAYMTAFGMKAALKLLHEKWQKEGKPLIEFRIGINTGQAIVGNFGSEDRFDYTAMGDTVNTASRLEGSANKTYGTNMIISTELNELDAKIRDGFLLREIDLVFLPGKNEPERLYELVELMASASDIQKNVVATYGKALALYRGGNFTEALKHFQSLGEDGPSKIMAERCKTLSSGGEIAELNGEYVFRIANK